MPDCDVCNVFVNRRKRLDVKRTDQELDYEILVCKHCYETCIKEQLNGKKGKNCKIYQKNQDLSEMQQKRKKVQNQNKLNTLAATTKNTKFFPTVPRNGPQKS